MARYLTMVKDHLKKLGERVIRQIPRKKNLKADTLARIVGTLLVRKAIMPPIYLQATPSITPEPVCSANEVDPDWMHNIVNNSRRENYQKTGSMGIDSAYRQHASL